MTGPDLTRWLLWCLVATVILYDVLAYRLGGLDATISRVVYELAKEEPLVPLAFGILLGHLFWPQNLLVK